MVWCGGGASELESYLYFLTSVLLSRGASEPEIGVFSVDCGASELFFLLVLPDMNRNLDVGILVRTS